MGSLWYIWVIGTVILLVAAFVVISRYRAEVKRYAAEEELSRLRSELYAVEERLASLSEEDGEYRDTRTKLDELKADEWLILAESALIRAKKVEAYECPKCFGEGIDERSFICDFCRGAGIIRADRFYTAGWTWDGSDLDEE